MTRKGSNFAVTNVLLSVGYEENSPILRRYSGIEEIHSRYNILCSCKLRYYLTSKPHIMWICAYIWNTICG